MANRLNMVIAKTHQLSSRVVGMQLTAGTFIGLALSALQMSAGFLTLNETMIAGNLLVGGLIAIVGILLAIMIERLSLGGLAAVRVASEGKKRLEENYYLIAEPTEQEQSYFKQRKKGFHRDMGMGWAFGAAGMVLSAGVGDVFWHHLFATLNPWIGIPMSIGCAGVIALNFIHAELFKHLMDMVLKAIMVDHDLQRTAVVAAEKDMQVNMMIDAYSSVQNDASVKGPVQERIKGVIGKRLSGFAREVSVTAEQVSDLDANAVEGSLGGSGRQLALPAPRGKYHQHKAELVRLLRANPGLSQRDIAQHFSISRSTANDWYKKLKSGA